MGSATFIMVVLGCGQPADACTPLGTMPVAYASEGSCIEARSDIVSLHSGLGFARVIAECRPRDSNVTRAAAQRALATD